MTTDEYDAIHKEMSGWLAKRIPYDEIEDVIQHVLLNWWVHRKEVQNIRKYIYASARNRCIDLYRQRDTQGWIELLPTDALVEPPDDEVCGQMLCDDVIAALRAKTTEKESALLDDLLMSEPPTSRGKKNGVLRGTLTQIAKRNGEKISTVKSRKLRLLGKSSSLRYMMEDATV